MKNNSLALYIHFPFCLHRCSYCDFYSITATSEHLMEKYVQNLVKEIQLQKLDYKNREITSVFWGGGTPSLLSGNQFTLLMNIIKENFNLPSKVEITLEANPATLDENKLIAYKAAGLNRISIGCQSFMNSELEILGRIHQVEDIYKTVDLIKKTRINNYNLDLIYGIPQQSIEKWLFNLEKAVSLEPAHISLYLLQLEATTPLGKRVMNDEVKMLSDETEEAMYCEAINYLGQQGYEQYEISNFARKTYECKHNLTYWQAQEYLGLGAGAVSFIDNKRCINTPAIADYNNYLERELRPPTEVLEVMNTQQLIEDAIILGLRLTAGIHIKEFNTIYRTDLLTNYASPIKESRAKKLLKIENGCLKLTKRGYFLSNQVLCHFIGN